MIKKIERFFKKSYNWLTLGGFLAGFMLVLLAVILTVQILDYIDKHPNTIECMSENNVTVSLVAEIVGFKGEETAGLGVLSFKTETSAYALGHIYANLEDDAEVYKLASYGFISSSDETIGEVEGTFSDDFCGEVISNTEDGVWISAENLDESKYENITIASEIKNGNAEILLRDETGTLQSYSVEISIGSRNGERVLEIELTDERLLEKTNGILQGMSGTPILQNGELVGVISHVFANHHNKGYGKIVWEIPEIQELLNADS